MKKRYIIAFIIVLFILYLTHHFWLGTKNNISFDTMLFLIILILGYLVSLKITSYLANFKTIKRESRIEILFLTIFFAILFIPMLHINQEDISKQENRNLSKLKPIITKSNKINFNFGKNFDSWYRDRFFLRNQTISLYQSCIYNLSYPYFKTKNGFINKRNKFIHTTWIPKEYNDIIIDKNINALNKFNDFCEQNNIKLYIVLVPQKEQIYPSNGKYKEYDKNLIKYLNSRHNNLKIIYPIRELYETSKIEFVYYKTEHHWTDTGAFVTYRILMHKVKQDFPNIKILDESYFNYTYNVKVNADWNEKYSNGSSCHYLGIPEYLCKRSLDTKYKYYTYKNKPNIQKTIIDIPYLKQKDFYNQGGAKYKVIVLGTSMGENLTKFIVPTFKEVRRIRTNNVINVKKEDTFKIYKLYGKNILDYKPNIIIFCVTYSNIPNFYNIFKK